MTISTVALFPDFDEGFNLSMMLYANRLIEGLAAFYPALDVKLYKPRKTEFPDLFKPLLAKIPYVRFYSRELFISRNITYPYLARRHQRQINHILGHNNANLAYHLDGARTVVTCHDLQPIVAYADAPVRPKWLKWFERRIGGMARAARVIAISESTKKDILKYTDVVEEKISVVYQGVDNCFKPIRDEKLLDDIANKYGIDRRSRRIILNVANNQQRKNHEGILKAVRVLRDRNPDILLLHVGDTLHSGQMELAKALGLADILQDVGQVSQEDLVSLYNLADVLLFPSFYEGCGWPILEAHACGTPVITSRTSSMPEMAGDAALIVDPYDIRDIANATAEVLINDHLRKSLIERGLQQVKKYSWENHVNGVISVYDDILSGERSVS
ncbi:MAG: glycosyltransferase family 1 protein [bacterium]